MFDLIFPTATSIKVFLYGECGGGRDTTPPRGTIIGTVVPVVALRKVTLTAVTFVEGTAPISTFRESFDTLESLMR